jgi:hypothetical protein
MTELNFNAHFIPFLEMLKENNIPHTVKVCGADGLKIVFNDGSDVALNPMTYGANEGLLEGYMGKFRTEYDDVTGYMTAQEAFEILTK